MKLFNPSLVLSIVIFWNIQSNAQNIAIPDINFKAYLVNNSLINTNNDSEIQQTEANIYNGLIDCSNLNITDLTGIESFINLTELSCHSNQLTNLNVSQLTNLTRLSCYSNQLTQLDVRSNTNLVALSCHDNQLTNLDVRFNTSLEGLRCHSNQINALNLQQNSQLTTLDCYSNQITNLNLSLNINLINLDCRANQLISLDIKNGNNINVNTFDATSNPALNCIQVDDSSYSATNWVQIDTGVTFNTNCNIAPIVYIPDLNFKTYLLNQSTINTNGDNEIQVNEATSYNQKIDCSNLNITDLTGIEAFVNLTELLALSNMLTSLDISQNTQLTTLWIPNNQLTSLNLFHNTALRSINCDMNQLTNLDLRQNTNLRFLSCLGNYLPNLDVRQNLHLTDLWLHGNQLSSLDLTQNTALTFLGCNMNQLTSLDLSQNPNLKLLHCTHNQLNSLNFKNGNNTAIFSFETTNNFHLTCIEVDNPIYSTNNWTDIDPNTTFQTNCSVVSSIAPITTWSTKVYPNPTTNALIVDFGQVQDEVHLRVKNISGKVVFSKVLENSLQTTIELQGAPGLYLIDIQTPEARQVLKVVKK